MSETSTNEIDFERLANLASSDPEKFEELRKKRISALINRTNGTRRQRLLGLQWQIDTIRARHKDSTLAACLAISELMWETFNELAEVLQIQAESGLSAPIPTVQTQGNILIFPGKSKS